MFTSEVIGALLVIIGGAIFSVGMAIAGIQGLLGVRDPKGRRTNIGVSVACLVLAALLAVATAAAPFWLFYRY
jgi:xanthine/uracil permease